MTATYLCLCNNGFIRKFTHFQRNTQMLKKNSEAVDAEIISEEKVVKKD